LARELGLPITVHVGMGKYAGKWNMVNLLEGMGLLRDDTTYIHCCYFSEEEWQLVRDSNGKISIAPQVEMQMGHGQPPVGVSRRYGLRPSLSIDVVTTVPGDMFTQMRCAFASERVLVNHLAWEKDEPLPDDALSARDVLEMATVNGAYTLGLEGKTGSLTPGSYADVVVIDGTAPATAPVIDGVAAVVLSADTAHVDTVIIGGKVHKRDGKLLADWAGARAKVQASRDYLLEQVQKAKSGAA
jgi:5-methylthioadenosine/S-adenosylhomocysteine deaminase